MRPLRRRPIRACVIPMVQKNVDAENLTVRQGADAPEGVAFHGEAVVVVHQAFGPTGESLVGVGDVEFDGFAAITLKVKSGERSGLVHLSPIHGDRRKEGETFPDGATLELLCPTSGKPLDYVPELDEDGAQYFAIYMTPRLAAGPAAYLSNVWGHYDSRVVDDQELISRWVAKHEG